MAFAVVVIVLLALALVAVAVLLVRTRRDLDALRRRVEQLDQVNATTAAELDAQSERLDAAQQTLAERDAELSAERERADAAKARASTAEAALRDTHAHLEAALRESESVSTTLDAVREELASATAKLATAGDSADAAALWALEIARSERRWHLSVSPGMDEPSPFEHTDDALRLAVEVEASALREEVGTRIDVAWQLDSDLPDEASLLVLRLAQELLADAATRAETLELTVGAEDDGVAVALRALDEEGSLVPVALPPLASGRVRPGDDGVWVVTRA